MSHPEIDAHTALYNGLPLMPDAYNILRRELDADLSVSNHNLISPILDNSELTALFRDGIEGENEGGLYAIWIIHKHFLLESGEQMVAFDNVSKPRPSSPTYIAERWDQNGNAIEFMQPSVELSDAKAPSRPFVDAFRALTFSKFGVSSLGICRAAHKLPPGYVYMETTQATTRAQIVEILPFERESGRTKGTIYDSGWVLGDTDGDSAAWCCECRCDGCTRSPVPEPTPPPQPPQNLN